MARVIKKNVSWRAALERSEGRFKEDVLRVRERARETDSLEVVFVDCSFARSLAFDVPGIHISLLSFIPLFEGDYGKTIGS